MKLYKKPLRPTSFQLQNNGRNFPPNFLHETWRDYLYWDTELENKIFFDIAIAVLQPSSITLVINL